MTIELGAVIAERRLRVAGQPSLDVRVRLGMPRPFDEEAQDFFCPYQITGIGSEKVKRAGGVDALQALELALHLLPTELDALRKEYPGLSWQDAAPGDYGFSKAASAFTNGHSRENDSG